jgi:excisionase family DNA binding protein
VYYSFNEVAKMLSVSRQTIYRMIEDGRLPAPIKLGNAQRSSVRFEKTKVDAALAAMQTGQMEIDHLVLARKDGSGPLRVDDVNVVSGDARQIGSVIELSVPGLGAIRARVHQKDDQTTSSRISEPYATGQLTVYATEL